MVEKNYCVKNWKTQVVRQKQWQKYIKSKVSF